MPTTEAMVVAACNLSIDHLEHDLQAAAQDADRYAVGVLDMLGQQSPSALLVGCPATLELFERRLASLLGCLAMGRRTIKQLHAMGVLV